MLQAYLGLSKPNYDHGEYDCDSDAQTLYGHRDAAQQNVVFHVTRPDIGDILHVRHAAVCDAGRYATARFVAGSRRTLAFHAAPFRRNRRCSRGRTALRILEHPLDVESFQCGTVKSGWRLRTSYHPSAIADAGIDVVVGALGGRGGRCYCC